MFDAIPVYCRQCKEPLDVYVPYEDRFCSTECYELYCEELEELENDSKINDEINGVEITNPWAWSR